MQPGPDVELRTCLLNLLCDLCIGLTEAFREAVPELSDRDNDSINRRLVLILLRFSTLKIKLEIRHLHISHNTPCLSPLPPPPKKKFTTFVFLFLLGITAVPGQILMQHLGELTRCIMRDVQMASRKILTRKFPFPVPRSPPLLLRHPIGVRSLGKCSSSRTRPGTRLWRIIRQC